jgi:four helix bundle protein
MIESYREFEVWQRAETLGHRVFTVTFPQYYFLNWSCRLRQAALSVSSALAAGCATTTPKAFLRQLRIARRSAERAKRLLIRASTRELLNAHDYQQLAAGYDELQSMTDMLARAMRQSPRLSVVRVFVAGMISVGVFCSLRWFFLGSNAWARGPTAGSEDLRDYATDLRQR